MDLIERDITLTCVSNDIGGRYVGSARWLGVPLTDLLDRAGIANTKADQILSTDVDGMTISTPFDLATDGRDAMIAIGMNGEALPREHGFPARMVVPGLYGFISATKWITRITLTTYAEQDAYWTERDWATDAPIKISSRIDTPKPLSTIDAGRTVIGGVAWAQHQGGIEKVEVRIDGGGWQEARLGPVGRPGLLAPVVPALDRRARPALARRPRRHRRGRDPDRRARHAVPERLQRHPGSRRHGPLKILRSVSNPLGPQHRTTPARHHYGRSQTMKRSSLNRASGLAALALTMSLGLPPAAVTPTPSPPPPRPRPRPPPRSPPRASRWRTTPARRPSAPAARPSPPRVTAPSTAWPPPRSPPPPAPTRCSRPWSPPSPRPSLVDTLNSAEDITVFAPTDDAFAKIPKKTLNAVLKDKATLTKILTHHVVAGQLGPDELAGEHETLAGDMLTVEGSGEEFTVAGDNAAVLCGNIPTANATVYVIDTVLMPAS